MADAKDQLGCAGMTIMFKIAGGSANFNNYNQRYFYGTSQGFTFEQNGFFGTCINFDIISLQLC